MNTDIGYGAQFDGWYDRIFQHDDSVRVLVDGLSGLHPEPSQGTLEFGVGTGRVALPLSERVGPVVGVDSSPQMLSALERKLSEGRGSGEGDGPAVTAERADIREYHSQRRYALVYAVCSTLAQILDPAEQRRVVARAAELLRPDGRLVIETHNRPAVHALHEGRTRTVLFAPYPEPNTGLQMHGTLLDDHIWHCSSIWFESDGTHRIGTETARLLTPDEVDAYAEDAGLRPEVRYSSWDGREYTPQAPMFITTYAKPA